MAYTKPGVEVTQLQTTASPNLTAPDLLSVIIGPGYSVREISENPDSTFMDAYSETYDNSTGATITTLSGLDTNWPTYDQNSLYIDLVGGTTANAGEVIHLTSDNWTATTSGLSIDASIGAEWTGAAIKIGYRSRKTNLNSLMYMDSQDEIKARVGLITTMNPLSQALSFALLTANKTVYGYGQLAADDSTHATALGYLGSKDVYTLVPLTHTAAVLTNHKDHVNFFSQPAQKRLRITVQNKKIPWVDSGGSSQGDYETGAAASIAGGHVGPTAQQMKANGLAYGEKRVFWTFPDTVYVRERRHISTLKQAYLNNMYTNEQLGLNALLANTVTMADGTKYYANEELTDALWTILQAEFSYLTCLVPVPGYYLASIVGGQISAYVPSAPFTNISIPGISRIKYSGDVFSETQLNTIAEGGNYIFVQPTDSSPITCRHQLSTDMSTVERRELSITKALDFCSKFLANALQPYIGRYNITPAFMKILSMSFSAFAIWLVREGHVNSVTIDKIEQDPIALDSVLVTLTVGVKYPVNYIKITLVF
jgi:hypothetical protein